MGGCHQGLGGEGRLGSSCLMGTEFQFCKTRKFWHWMVATGAEQCECTSRHQAVHLKMVKMVHFMFWYVIRFLKT